MDKVKLLQLTKELTNETDLEKLISSAEILKNYLKDNQVEETKHLTFAEFVKMVGYKPFNFYKDGKFDRIAVVIENRRKGATTFAILYSLWKLINIPNYSVIFYSIQKQFSENKRTYFTNIITEIPQGYLPGLTVCNRNHIKFDNGSSIKFIHGLEETRGIAPDLFVLDDASYIPYKESSHVVERFATGGSLLAVTTIERREQILSEENVINKLQKYANYIVDNFN